MTNRTAPSPGVPSDEPGVPTRRAGPWRVVAAIVTVVLGVFFLRLAKPVLLPLTLGLFLAVLAHPLHQRMRDALPRWTKWLALVATMLLLLAALAAFATAIGWSGRAVMDELRTRRPQIERQLAQLRGPASQLGIDLPRAPGGTETAASAGASGGASGGAQEAPRGGDQAPTGDPAAPSGDAQGSTPQRVAKSVLGTLAMIGLALAFTALGLAETGEAHRRIRHLGAPGERMLDIAREASPAFRRYVWVKSLTSFITGLATALASLAFGLPLAWVWGFIAFLLEYVPTVGSLLAVAPPTLMALAEGGPQKAALVLLVVGALQIILGNVVDPRLEGRLMAVSPFGVLLSIVFWGWLWGATGALLAVPLTVAVVIVCRHVPALRGIATVVAGDGVPDEDEGRRDGDGAGRGHPARTAESTGR